MITQVAKVESGYLPKLQNEVTKFNKKLSGTGLPALQLEVAEEPIREVVASQITISYSVTIIGQLPVLNGWRFVATIQHRDGGNVIHKLDLKATVPEKYRATKPELCEHCNTERLRNNTYLVQSGDSWLQVGSSCLKKGIGVSTKPQLIALYLEFIFNFQAVVIRVSQGKKAPTKKTNSYDLKLYLAYVFYSARKDGWVSKGQAAVKNIPSTSELALTYMKQSLKIDAVFFIYAEKAIVYARQIMVVKSEYESNLKVMLSVDIIEERDLGYAASLAIQYREYVAAKKEKVISQHFGKEGERIQTALTLIRTKEFTQNDRKTTAYHFEDHLGNKATWFSSAPVFLEVGQTYNMKVTVSRHDVFQDVKYTVLQRCEVV